jgi:hypothetical protein
MFAANGLHIPLVLSPLFELDDMSTYLPAGLHLNRIDSS